MRAALGIVLSVVFLAGPWLGAGILFASTASLQAYAAQAPTAAFLLAFLLCPVLVTAGLVSTTALAVALGMVLPFSLAWMVGVVACVIATVAQLLLARSTLAPTLARFANRSDKTRAIAESFATLTPWKTTAVFAVARLAPHVPFAATNFALGALRPHLVPAVLGSAMGAVGRMGVFAWVGIGVTDFAQIGTQDAGQLWGIVTIVSGVALLALVSHILVRKVGLAR